MRQRFINTDREHIDLPGLARSEVITMTQTKLPTRDELGTMLITDVLERWPAAAEVFMAHRMACAGCALARFYTVNDAALVYSLDATRFVEELMATLPASVEE